MRRLTRASARPRRAAARMPRLALWAGAGVLLCAMALSCGEDEYEGGPRGDPNPNDPHPVWVFFYDVWAKYDQNGHELLKMKQRDPEAKGIKINPATGDIWAFGEGANVGELFIFNGNGMLKKKVGDFGYEQVLAFDTNAGVVWLHHQPLGSEKCFLKKLDYNGRILSSKALPEEMGVIWQMGVDERSGGIWAMVNPGEWARIYKLNNRGEVSFCKEAWQLGLSDYGFDQILVDQTDGGVWLNASPWYLLKLDESGKRAGKILVAATLEDIGYETGNLLVSGRSGDTRYIRLYTNWGRAIWQIGDTDEKFDACVADFDGSCWYLSKSIPMKITMAKIDSRGTEVLTDIEVPPTYLGANVEVAHEPYPY